MHRGDSWHSAVCKRPLKAHRASVLGYIKVISCQASRKHPPPSASKTADWSRHPVWHIWARESNENSCFCPYGIQRLAAWRCAVPTWGKLSIINPEIWPAYEALLIKTSGDGGGDKGGGVTWKGSTLWALPMEGKKRPWQITGVISGLRKHLFKMSEKRSGIFAEHFAKKLLREF